MKDFSKAGWKAAPLGELAQIRPNKKEAKSVLADDDEVSFVPMDCLEVDQVALAEHEARPLGKVYGGYTYFRDGDVLLAKITPCFENGKLGIANDLTNGVGFGSSEFFVLRPSEELLAGYLYHFLNRQSFRDWAKGRMTGAVGHKRVPKELVEALEVPLPPLEEQQRIVAVLDEAFEGLARARAHAEANLQNARELFDRAAFELFESLRTEHTTLALGELTEKITKGSSPKWQGISYVEEPGVLFVTSENVAKNEIDLTKTKYVEEAFNEKDRKSILAKGDVLTNIVGASIGRTAVFELDEVANINQAVCMIRCDSARLNNYYLSYLLNSPYFKAQLHAGEVNMARANLSLTFFRELQVPVPPLNKQDETVQEIEALRHQTSALETDYQSKLQDLEDLRQSLLQQAFAGELT